MFIPMAFPLSFGGYIEVIIARAVTNAIAEPIPCKTRNEISEIAEGATADSREEMVKIIIP